MIDARTLPSPKKLHRVADALSSTIPGTTLEILAGQDHMVSERFCSQTWSASCATITPHARGPILTLRSDTLRAVHVVKHVETKNRREVIATGLLAKVSCFLEDADPGCCCYRRRREVPPSPRPHDVALAATYLRESSLSFVSGKRDETNVGGRFR